MFVVLASAFFAVEDAFAEIVTWPAAAGTDPEHTKGNVVSENVDSRFPIVRRNISSSAGLGHRFTLEWKEGGAQPVEVVDFGPECVGGFAVFEVEEFSPAASGTLPVVRLSYANHPDGLTAGGDFTRETSATYLHVDNPVLPANINRHELYTIPRVGKFIAPLVQGQVRYARIALDTPGTKVKMSRFDIVNAGVHDDTPPRGRFKSDSPRDEAVWRMGVRTCQLASFPNPDAWRVVEGVLVPRKLEKGDADGWCRFVPDFEGTLEVTHEFRWNPHFPKGAFKVFTGLRDTLPEVVETITQTGPDGVVKTATVPLKPGRFGFSIAKEQWPMIHSVVVKDASGTVRWREDFSAVGTSKPAAADNWIYPTAESYIADGGKRDRLVWSGDLWWAQRTMYYAWGANEPYMRGALRLLAFNQTPEGFCHAAPYAENRVRPRSNDYGAFASDEFSAWLVPCAWEHYLFTGDELFAREIWPAVDRDLRYLASRMGKRGLLEPRFETSKHADNMNCGDTYDSLYQNILLWMCWRDGARLALALGEGIRATQLESLADAHAQAIRAHFKNADGSWSGTRGTDVTEERRLGLLIASGFCTRDEALWTVRSNRHFGVGKEVSLYVRGCFRYGFARSAMREISIDNWYSLIHPEWKGAHCCSECLFLVTKGWWDESHPDTSISDIYPAYILGVEPLTPGFREFRIAPQIACGLSHAEGRVPTRFGDIEMAWKLSDGNLTLDFSVPEGTAARVQGKRFGAGRHTYSRKVGKEDLVDESFDECIADGYETRDLGYTMSQIFYSKESDYSQIFDLDRVVDVRRVEFFPAECGFPGLLVIEGAGEDGTFRQLKRLDGLKDRKATPLVADVVPVGSGVRYLRLSAKQAPVMTPGRSWAVQFNNIRIVSHVR